MIGEIMAALRQLENTSSTTDKRRLVVQYCKTIPEFGKMLLYALDPYKKYGVKRFPAVTTRGGENTWGDIEGFLKSAVRRDCPQSSTNTYLFQLAEQLSPDGRELLKRIINKDLRCGVGATLVNSVAPGFIPQFGVQLAAPLEAKHSIKLAQYPAVYAQPKLNGDRVVAICAPGAMPDMLSRKGFSLLNYNTIAEKLYHVQRTTMEKGVVFDGEMIVGNFFKTRSVKKLAGNNVEDAVYHVFDVIPYPQWRKGETDVFSVRRKLLQELEQSEKWDTTFLQRVKSQKLSDISWEALNELRDKLIAAGYEGLIIRPDLPYEFRPDCRSSMYKHKKMDTMDCTVLEVEEGEAGKKYAGTAGKLVVELPNGQPCKAGLKLSNAQRDKLWAARNRVAGLTAEIQFQEKTQNKSGEYKLQFPVFVRFRSDKS